MKPSLLISLNVGLLLSYIFTYSCHDEIKTYSKDLSDDLLMKYNAIKNERMLHFGIGVVLALVSGLAFYNLSPGFSALERTNIVILILLLLPMMVYKLLPKSDYMLTHTQTEQDYKDWFTIYSCMKNQSIYGFLCGFTVCMILLSIMNVE
jgi:hypothetical protein